jgi:methylated-DNA-[protein]-cysteine S-methyltransferase
MMPLLSEEQRTKRRKKCLKEMHSYAAVLSTLIGAMGLCFSNGFLTRLDFIEQPDAHFVQGTHPSITQLIQEIQHYFSGRLQAFQTLLSPSGTAFQQAVWQRLLAIPYGQVATYGQLAFDLKTSPRAVGNACRQNPISLLIPCHRVVAKDGLGGYAGNREGHFISMKTWLLDHEKATCSSL